MNIIGSLSKKKFEVFQSKLSLVYRGKENYSTSEEEGGDDGTGSDGESGSASPGDFGFNTGEIVFLDPEIDSVSDLVVDVGTLFLEGDGVLLLGCNSLPFSTPFASEWSKGFDIRPTEVVINRCIGSNFDIESSAPELVGVSPVDFNKKALIWEE